jgi:hypothetical protein
MVEAYTLAYYDTATIVNVKKFQEQAPGFNSQTLWWGHDFQPNHTQYNDTQPSRLMLTVSIKTIFYRLTLYK